MPDYKTSIHGRALGLDKDGNLVNRGKPRSMLPAPTVINTAGAGTITAAHVLTGIIARDPNGGNRTDTLPTAATLVAAMDGAEVGDVIDVLYANTADAAETITLAAGTGGTVGNTKVTTAFGQNTALSLKFRITDVATPAYTVYAG